MRSSTSARTLGAVCVTITVVAMSLAARHSPQQRGEHADAMHIYPLAEIQWKEGPGSLPSGSTFAVLEGDPAKEGQFTMRLKLPDGFRIPPHWHTGVEHVTVISGTFNVGTGEKFDQAGAKRMPAGAFGYWPAGMRHFAWTQGETILQLHGLGPWTITYVNPADDPRTKK